MLTGKHTETFSKDTVYRFLNSSSINWMRFTTLLSAKIATSTITKLTDENRVNVLIVDDTMFERNSSKKVELLSKIYDHAKKTYKYGFRLLTLGWSDGNTFLPVNGCLLSSENKKSHLNEAKILDKRTIGFARRKSLMLLRWLRKHLKCIAFTMGKCSRLPKYTDKTENAEDVQNISYPLKFPLLKMKIPFQQGLSMSAKRTRKKIILLLSRLI